MAFFGAAVTAICATLEGAALPAGGRSGTPRKKKGRSENAPCERWRSGMPDQKSRTLRLTPSTFLSRTVEYLARAVSLRL